MQRNCQGRTADNRSHDHDPVLFQYFLASTGGVRRGQKVWNRKLHYAISCPSCQGSRSDQHLGPGRRAGLQHRRRASWLGGADRAAGPACSIGGGRRGRAAWTKSLERKAALGFCPLSGETFPSQCLLDLCLSLSLSLAAVVAGWRGQKVWNTELHPALSQRKSHQTCWVITASGGW